ncbi:MAG: CpsD/CapB family tyrosine-protein kinase [Okeania sp. SIO3B5]|uniref:KGGVGR-motif variant AAA ATPase n=1 Tax=Okeania sp. SIO3B5 TaxID=2607811 RepID=UPI0013FE99A7|nr:AAA family ATPase [Okeania sp. SIO3B5]NEO52725.1 CpsD/CapB family tyrosine-protein kinase [Okeania sp. SIO3B5]
MIDITFSATFEKVRECFAESPIKDKLTQNLESITIIRDVVGKIRIFLEPLNNSKLEDDILNDLENSLRKTLGNYYGEDIWLPQGEKDGYKALIDVICQERVLAEWDDGNKPHWYVLERHVAKQAWTNKNVGQPPWSQKVVDEGHKPAIVSFFSFKGGVGRTTTLVATALTLARHGHRIAIVDLDLESPGLSTVFSSASEESIPGVIDYLLEKNIQSKNWKLRTHLKLVNEQKLLGDTGESLSLLGAGSVDDNYLEKLARLDFQNLLNANNQLPETWQNLFKELNAVGKLDFILLDTRTGFHDLGGLAIADLSHAAVIFGTQSRQSWKGLTHVIRRLARPLAPEPLPVLLVHALAPGLDVKWAEQELGAFREKAYIVFQEHYYREDVPKPDDREASFYPIIINWQSELRREVSLFKRDSTPEEDSRLSYLIDVLTGKPYQQLAERLCTIFKRKLNK